MALKLAIGTHPGEIEVFLFWCSGLNRRHLVNQNEIEVFLPRLVPIRSVVETRISVVGIAKSSDASSRSRNLRVEVSAYEPGTLTIAPRRC